MIRRQKYVAFVIPLLSFASLLRLWSFHHHSSDDDNRLLLPPPPPTEILIIGKPDDSESSSSLLVSRSSSASASSTTPEHAVEAFVSKNDVSLLLRNQNVSLRVDRLLQNYSGTIEPMWTCSSKGGATEKQHNNSKKLIFVHVFKTAGSTFRTFFLHYSLTCRKGYALLVQCSGLSPSSLTTTSSFKNNNTTTTTWINGFGRHKNKPCVVKSFVDHHRRSIGTTTISNKLLLQHKIDVLIGHLPVGVHQHWVMNDKNAATAATAAVQAQYVAFFRDPLHKYVSGIVFSSAKKLSKMTFNETVQMIKQRVRAERAKGHFHEGYSAYLLTPEQKELFYGSSKTRKGKRSLEDRIELILGNLVHLNVLVGIVERMPESLELLQHVVDGKKELTRSFDYLSGGGNKRDGDDTTNRTVATTAPLVLNKSKLSTRDIAQALRQDETAARDLEEYLKFDTIIYQFALEMHKRQYQRLHERNNTMKEVE